MTIINVVFGFFLKKNNWKLNKYIEVNLLLVYTLSIFHQKPSNTWRITQPEVHRDLLPELDGPWKKEWVNEIAPNVMNIHDVIIIKITVTIKEWHVHVRQSCKNKFQFVYIYIQTKKTHLKKTTPG